MPLPPVNALGRRLFGRTAAEAIEAGECIRCRDSVDPGLLSEVDAAEYRLSGICPTCWTELFPEDDECE